MNYTALTVGEKEFKLRLDTKNTVALEKVLGTNPVNEIMKCAQGQLPSFDFTTAVLHASLQKYHHKMTMQKVYELVDEAIDEGKSLTDFIPTLMDVFQVSGIIPKSDVEEEVEEDADPKPLKAVKRTKN